MRDPKVIYVVAVGLPGCSPDPEEIVAFRSAAAAQRYADREAEEWGELLCEMDEGAENPFVYDVIPVPWAQAQADGWLRQNLIDDPLYDPDFRPSPVPA